MLTRLTRSLRRAGILVGAGALALAAVLIPASPAQAALPSGWGWSGSWNYNTTSSFRYEATLPGVRVTGSGTDLGGTRTTRGTVADTANDGRCARVQVYADGRGIMVDRTVCDGGGSVAYSTGSFTGRLIVFTHRTRTDGTPDKSQFILIPDSVSDPTLRTVGTGYRWSYYGSTAFEFTVIRPGVEHSGSGVHQTSGTRSVGSTLFKPEATPGCATASVWAATGGPNMAIVCGKVGIETVPSRNYLGWIEADACYTRDTCLLIHIPEPQ